MIAKELAIISQKNTSEVKRTIKYLGHTLCKIYQFQRELPSQ